MLALSFVKECCFYKIDHCDWLTYVKGDLLIGKIVNRAIQMPNIAWVYLRSAHPE
jgi:hypothetical protein